MFGITNGFDIVIGNPPYIQLQKAFNEKQKYADLYKNENYKTFERTGDIYALFYEKGIDILNKNGSLCYITSNKWMRANYGKSLRKFFSGNNPLKLIDLGPGIFEAATVDTNILLVQNIRALVANNVSHEFTNKKLKALTLTDKNKLNNLSDKDFTTLTDLSEQSWVILSPQEQIIKEQTEKVGTPLKDWDINIYRGVLTGFNEAFIINGKTKDELIAKDPKSAEIIKPILRGRDIKRYKAEFVDLWLIFITWHFPLHKDPSISGASQKAEKAFREQYPAIYNHLLQYKEKLSKRNKAETGIRYEWYALQRCAATYYTEFEKEKIVFQEMVQYSSFIYDTQNNFSLDTGRILTGERIKFLTALLNSSLFFYSIKNFYGGGSLGTKGVRMKHTFFERFPAIRTKKTYFIETLVDYILYLKDPTNGNLTERADNEHIALFFEDVIDGCVFELYFEDHMKERNINILDMVTEQLKLIDGKDKKKDGKIILSAWLKMRKSEIAERMRLFTVKSPDILKIIIQS